MRDRGRTVRADRTPGGNHIGRVSAFARTRNLPDRVRRRHESAPSAGFVQQGFATGGAFRLVALRMRPSLRQRPGIYAVPANGAIQRNRKKCLPQREHR
jgi:hypothetical protein